MELVVIIVLQLLLIALATLFIFKYATFGISQGYDVPFVETPSKYLTEITEALHIGPGDIVYDLGSGDGRVVLHLARQFPEVKVVGIERNPLLCAYSNIKARRLANATFVRADIFDTDFSDATRIYAYLMTKPLNDLYTQNKFAKVRLVSRAFKLAGRNADAIVELTKKPGVHGEHLLHVYDL
jgi:SAM-dependent methyltransferase